MESEAGPRLIAGRYELRAQIGRGGMGTVWRAWDLQLEREVAVKAVQLPQGLTPPEREEAHGRTRREARSTARLSHPSVVAVHDVFDAEGHPWIVMELIQGRTVAEILRERGPMPLESVVSMASALLSALILAHSRGVVHRDVKPANVMVTDDGQVKLTDFGIATIEGDTAITRTGAILGSPEYMAPERLEHERDLPASDIWSLGATLYAALEGRSPFKRETIPSSISAVLTAPVPRPARAGSLTPILLGMLDRDPDRRLGAAQAAQMLPSAMPPAAPPFPPAPDPAGPAQPHPARPNRLRWWSALVLAALLFGCLGSGLTYFLVSGADPATGAAAPEEQEKEEDVDYQRWVHIDSDSVEYPADWKAEFDDEAVLTSFVPEGGGDEVDVWMNSYMTPSNGGAKEVREEALVETERVESEFWTDLDGYRRTHMREMQVDTLPDTIEVVEWEYTYTDEETFPDHPKRYVHRWNVFVPDLSHHVIEWDLATARKDDYDDVIARMKGTFVPSVYKYE